MLLLAFLLVSFCVIEAYYRQQLARAQDRYAEVIEQVERELAISGSVDNFYRARTVGKTNGWDDHLRLRRGIRELLAEAGDLTYAKEKDPARKGFLSLLDLGQSCEELARGNIETLREMDEEALRGWLKATNRLFDLAENASKATVIAPEVEPSKRSASDGSLGVGASDVAVTRLLFGRVAGHIQLGDHECAQRELAVVYRTFARLVPPEDVFEGTRNQQIAYTALRVANLVADLGPMDEGFVQTVTARVPDSRLPAIEALRGSLMQWYQYYKRDGYISDSPSFGEWLDLASWVTLERIAPFRKQRWELPERLPRLTVVNWSSQNLTEILGAIRALERGDMQWFNSFAKLAPTDCSTHDPNSYSPAADPLVAFSHDLGDCVLDRERLALELKAISRRHGGLSERMLAEAELAASRHSRLVLTIEGDEARIAIKNLESKSGVSFIVDDPKVPLIVTLRR